MPKTILVDCDCVLLDTIEQITLYARDICGIDVSEEEKSSCYPDEWGFFDDKEDDILPFFQEWQATEWFENIPPMKGAVEAVKGLKDKGYKIVVVTAAGKLEEAETKRWKNLDKVFGKDVIDDLIFVEWNTSKKDVLKRFEPTFFIEDYHENAIESLEVGHKPILLRIPQNERCIVENEDRLKNVAVLGDWNAISDYILNDA
jgi:hypothetical protein